MTDDLRLRIGGQLDVLRLGFGAMRITGPGIWGDPPDRDEAIRTLRRAVELGADFIDTADSYGPFVSEDLIAQVPITESVGAIPGTSKVAHLEQNMAAARLSISGPTWARLEEDAQAHLAAVA